MTVTMPGTIIVASTTAKRSLSPRNRNRAKAKAAGTLIRIFPSHVSTAMPKLFQIHLSTGKYSNASGKFAHRGTSGMNWKSFVNTSSGALIDVEIIQMNGKIVKAQRMMMTRWNPESSSLNDLRRGASTAGVWLPIVHVPFNEPELEPRQEYRHDKDDDCDRATGADLEILEALLIEVINDVRC